MPAVDPHDAMVASPDDPHVDPDGAPGLAGKSDALWPESRATLTTRPFSRMTIRRTLTPAGTRGRTTITRPLMHLGEPGCPRLVGFGALVPVGCPVAGPQVLGTGSPLNRLVR
jgi:hypothetical protein